MNNNPYTTLRLSSRYATFSEVDQACGMRISEAFSISHETEELRTSRNQLIANCNKAREILTNPEARRLIDIQLDLEQGSEQSLLAFFNEDMVRDNPDSYDGAQQKLARFIANSHDEVWNLVAPHIHKMIEGLEFNDSEGYQFFNKLSILCNDLKRDYITDSIVLLDQNSVGWPRAALGFVAGANTAKQQNLVTEHLPSLFDIGDLNEIANACINIIGKVEPEVQLQFLQSEHFNRLSEMLTNESVRDESYRFDLLNALAESRSPHVQARVLDLLDPSHKMSISEANRVKILSKLVEHGDLQKKNDPDIQWRILKDLPDWIENENHRYEILCQLVEHGSADIQRRVRDELPRLLQSEQLLREVLYRLVEHGYESQQHDIHEGFKEDPQQYRAYGLTNEANVGTFLMTLYQQDRSPNITRIRPEITDQFPALARACEQRMEEERRAARGLLPARSFR
jgi:hypothetical protein